MKCTQCKVKQATRLCGACEFVPYCGEECADKHWPLHAIEAHSDLISDEVTENVADQVWPGIWIGGVKALAHLDNLGIGAVLTAMHVDKDGVESMLAKRVGDRPHLRFKWYDSRNQELTLPEMCRAASFIEQYSSKGGVLVHCWAGHSRSVSVVLFYLMKKTNRFKSVAEALAYIQKKRIYASPNSGFLAQLEDLVKQPGC